MNIFLNLFLHSKHHDRIRIITIHIMKLRYLKHALLAFAIRKQHFL